MSFRSKTLNFFYKLCNRFTYNILFYKMIEIKFCSISPKLPILKFDLYYFIKNILDLNSLHIYMQYKMFKLK